jgi:hypothetical protein
MATQTASTRGRRLVNALKQALGFQDAETPAPPRRFTGLFCFLFGLAFVGAAFAYLEITQPYYFTQDDNFCETLPVHLQACRSFFSGEFPEWNPYQLLGAPTARLGLYALTYPPVYIAYAVARFVLGNEYCAFDVLAFLHLAMAFGFTYWAARQWRIGPPLTLAAACAYSLSGYTLIVGRSWGGTLLTLAWLPLYIGAVAPLTQRRVTWRWIVGFGLVVGLSYHSAFVQFWVYILLFTALAIGVLWLAGFLRFSNALASAIGVLLGLGIAAPLLYVQMTYGADVERSVANEGFPFAALIGALLPYPLVKLGHPLGAGWGDFYLEYMGHFYYAGTLFAGVTLLLIPILAACFWSRKVIARNIWILCAALALILALGDKAGLWHVLVSLPWLNKFRMPWRLYIFFNLFAAMGGAIFLQRLFATLKRRVPCEIAAAALVIILMAYNVVMAKPTFYTFGDKPYPAPSPEMAPLLESAASATPQRAASLMPMRRVPMRSRYPNYALSLEQNFASIYGIPAATGYDPLVWLHPFCNQYLSRILKDRQAAYRAWGVRWAVLYGRSALRLRQQDYPELRAFKGANSTNLFLWDVDKPAPLAFPVARPQEAFPIAFSAQGVRVDLANFPEGGPFVVNILAWPDFKATADGKPIEFQPDDWGRMRLEIPAGTTTLEARYAPPWGKGFLVAAVVLVVALALAAALDTATKRMAGIG